MNWKSKLTKKQTKHLEEQGITSISQFIEVRTTQELVSPNREACWECREIAKRLELGA